MRTESFFVPFMARSTNAIYTGTHYAVRKKEADAGHNACMDIQCSPFDKPVSITYVPVVGKGGRKRDVSNYSYCAKIIEDGLVRAGIVPDDTDEWVKGFHLVPAQIDRKVNSGMWVTVQEVGEMSGTRWLEENKPWRDDD